MLKSKLFYVGLVGLTLLMLVFVANNNDRDMTLTVLDVGQGQSVVIKTPGGKIIALDCGSTSSKSGGKFASSVTRGYLRSIGKRNIDLAIVSHPHDDHINGYPYLMKKIKIKRCLDIGVDSDTPEYKQFIKQAVRSHVSVHPVNRGDTVSFADGVTLRILHPQLDQFYSDLNEASMVVRISYGKVSFIVAADTGFEAESEMLAEGVMVDSDVLVVGHHGSDTTSSYRWVQAVSPVAAAISVGRRNRYGHPSEEVLLRLERLKVKVYRTDKNGAITFTTDGRQLKVKTFLRSVR